MKQAFLDDRKSKAMNDRREQELRAARAARGSSPPTSPQSTRPSRVMPGSGQSLSGATPSPPPPAYTSLRRRNQDSDDDMSD